MSKSTADNMQSVSSGAVAEALNTIFVGSCVIDRSTRTLTTNGSTAILGAYGYGLFNFNITVPSGWHKEYVLSAQVSTDGAGQVRVRLNNIATNYTGTWSVSTFRHIVCSPRFKESDIVLETTLGYSNKGTNLYIQAKDMTGNQGYVYSVVITCLLVKD